MPVTLPGSTRPAAKRPRLLRDLLRSTAGVSAVEFAIMSPVLVLACFGMTDIGMAVYERMMMNQVLRAGAQPAFQGMNDGVVLTVLQETATENFTVADGAATGDELQVGVDSHCACPGEATVAVTCGATCASGSVALRLYRLTASKAYQGVILPEFSLSSSLEVMQQ
jgi:Flp pilus assembly protein TadG